jgi:hypothetical protein
MRVVLANATLGDLAVIGDSWRKSGRNTPRTHKWPREAYEAWANLHVEQTLSRCLVMVARPEDWGEGVLAWSAVEGDTVHWAYCKEPFRRHGLVSLLLEAQGMHGALYAAKSFHAGADALVRKFGLRFAPEASNRRKAG